MNHSPKPSASKPSLEALLRLKRAERPDDAFWSDFEIGMLQKQLAAIIEPKPWWLGASLALRRFSLPAVVVTSGAAALFALMVVRSGSPVAEPGFTTASVSSLSSVGDEIAGSESPSLALSPAALPVAVDPLKEVVPVVAKVEAPVLLAAVEPVASDAAVESSPQALEIENSTLMVASADLSEPAVDVVSILPEPFEVAARNFASVSWQNERVAVQGEDFVDLAAVQAATFAFNSSVIGKLIEAPDESVIPAAVAPAPGSRFERLLANDASKVAATSSGTLEQVRDRVLHHLGRDEELYASVSRLGVGGDRLSLRF